MIRFDCPCGESLDVPHSRAGEVETCPACGCICRAPVLPSMFPPPRPRPARRGGMPAWAVPAITLGVFAAVLLAVVARTQRPPASPPGPPLDILVRDEGLYFRVENHEPRPITVERFWLNDAYRVEPFTVQPGTAQEIGLLHFADADGVRFDPLARKVVRWQLRAVGTDGRAATRGRGY